MSIKHHAYVFIAAVLVILAALLLDSYTGITNTAV